MKNIPLSEKIYREWSDITTSNQKSCFCTGRDCKMYEQCFEKDKIISRQDAVIKELLDKMFKVEYKNKREGAHQ